VRIDYPHAGSDCKLRAIAGLRKGIFVRRALRRALCRKFLDWFDEVQDKVHDKVGNPPSLRFGAASKVKDEVKDKVLWAYTNPVKAIGQIGQDTGIHVVG